jgi:hypothetical protein
MRSKRGDGSIFFRGKIAWIKYYRNGKAFRESSGSEKESEARKFLKQRQGEIALGRFMGRTLIRSRFVSLQPTICLTTK